MFPLNPFESLKKKFYLIITLVMIAFLIIVLLPIILNSTKVKQTKQIQEPAHILTVSAEGKVKLIPDLAIIQVGVETIKPTSIEAQNENSKKMNAVIEAIKNEGVKKEDIQTTNYSLQDIYDYTDKGRVFKGYQATQNVTVKIRDINNIGKILEAVGAMGANQIGGVKFTIDNPEISKNQALKEAITKAKAKAQELATSADIKLGKIISLNESSSSYVPQPYYALEKRMGGGDAVTPNIEAGETEITAQITLIFEIK